jgi:AraC family transcriptional activator of pobA
MKKPEIARYFSDEANSILKVFAPKDGILKDGRNELYSILWNRGRKVELEIDGSPFTLLPNHILTFTPSHHFVLINSHEKLLVVQFNDGFYCVDKHDKELGCIGVIFYGASNIVSLLLDVKNQGKFQSICDMLIEEFTNKDNQREMLTILLKKLIISSTRIAKRQFSVNSINSSDVEVQQQLIRDFNILVEVHHKQEHQVAFYAKKLHKSPKTLANYFLLFKLPSPLAIIHNRLVTEAKRQILFSDRSVKEIAFYLGFSDLQAFSRFCKSKTGSSPTDWRKRKNANPSGTPANSNL